MMRLAAISDIHGNLAALNAVLDDVRHHSPDIVVNLGDHLSGPLDAAETCDLLMDRDFVMIRGNHERQLLGGFEHPETLGPSDRAAQSRLEARHWDWIRSLPETRMLDSEILLCHGSPRGDLEYLLESVSPEGARLALPESVESRLASVNAKLVLCGHTHKPRHVRTRSGIDVVNPGSVGIQAYDDTHPYPHVMENGSPHARYAILDRVRGAWRVQQITVEYDWDTAARRAREAQRLDWAKALATGYALTSSER